MTNLPENVADLHHIINTLKARNDELMDHLQSIENPERTLLVVCHDEKKEDSWAEVLQMLYVAAFENRLAFSAVKDKDGVEHMALCGVAEEGENGMFLYPLFKVENVEADHPWSFPAPNGTWSLPGEAIETACGLQPAT